MNQIQFCFRTLIVLTLFNPNYSFSQDCSAYASSKRTGPLSYQGRPHGGCEGFISDKTSASKFDVVSFTFGKFEYDDSISEKIYLQTPKGFGKPLNVEAKGVPSNLDYRMDALIARNEIFPWDTGEVLLQNEKTKKSENIGVTGYLRSSKNKKIYVPLRIVDNENSEYLFIIFRSNGSLRGVEWKTSLDKDWRSKSGNFVAENPILLIFENKPGIDQIKIKGINDGGDEINETIDLELK